MMPFSADYEANRTISAKNFHQTLWLPESAGHPKLKITYSTTTNFDDVSLPAVFFIGPMYCSRWQSLHVDKLARDCGVRVVCVDRPGFGGSTPVGIDMRMSIWLEMVPVLLQKVGVEHVSLVTHSAGTMYTLNTLLHHRSLLEPKVPYVAFMAPWVSVVHSEARLLAMVAKLPTNIIESWSGVMTFVATKIMPSAAWSGGIISSTAALLSPAASGATSAVETSDTAEDIYGMDKDTSELVQKLSMKCQFAETNTGLNEEAKLCLRHCNEADWGEAWDYASCSGRIADNEAALTHGEPNATKLIVEAYFAASDIMIATKGQQFFEECWQSDKVKGKVEFTTSTLPGTDHDSVLVDQKKGALNLVFQRIARLHKEGS